MSRTETDRAAPTQIPDEIANDPELETAMKVLPVNYDFEVKKTVWRLRQVGVKTLALQFPEGLLLYATTLSDIFQTFAGVRDVVILGDVTYGACCVDDYTAESLGCDFLVHYGHSCLVPVDVTRMKCLYVFVDISFDVGHLCASVEHNFKPGSRLILAGTIQFASAIQETRTRLAERYPSLAVPQAKPLSPGEVLGCTAPVIEDAKDRDAIVFVADGRFNLEAIMIANPTVPAFRYDPYQRILTREEYAHKEMRSVRKSMVSRAKDAKTFGIVLGTLGRQGNPAILEHLMSLMRVKGREYVVFLISEMNPAKMAALEGLDAFVQVACPRLSIDWGEEFDRPVLTPYEAEVALDNVEPWWLLAGVAPGEEYAPYPMDYYAKDGGSWSSSYHKQTGKNGKPKRAPVRIETAE